MKNEKLKMKKVYGKELILDLSDCDPRVIRSKKKILEYLKKICDLIEVKKYGRPIIERFGLKSRWGAGYSFFQFIEESSISGHFLESQNSAYLNIFSCKLFDDKKTTEFSKKFFKAKKIKNRALIR